MKRTCRCKLFKRKRRKKEWKYSSKWKSIGMWVPWERL